MSKMSDAVGLVHPWRTAAALVAAGLVVLGLLATVVRLDTPADPGIPELGWSTWQADGVVIDVPAAEPNTVLHSGDVVTAIAGQGAGISARILQHFSRAASAAPFPQLTEREHEVLRLIAGDADNAAVSRRLGVSGKTVRNYVSNIITKLQVTDRTAAVLKARDAVWAVPPAIERQVVLPNQTSRPR